MPDQVIYAGPGKIKRGNLVLHAEGPQGRIIAKHSDGVAEAKSSLFGTVKKYAQDLFAEIDVTPFDDWSMLPYLFPLKVVQAGGAAGALTKGMDPFTAAKVATTIWGADGRLYPYRRTAVIGHPTIHLGVDKAFFGGIKIGCLGALDKQRNDADFLMDAITESAGAEPAGNYDPENAVRGNWIGTWGDFTIEAEDEWVITPNITYNTHKSQGVSKKMTLGDVSFSISCRPVGPTHTDLLVALRHGLGSALAGLSDLVLTNNDGTTITMKMPEVTAGGHEFGGNQLGTGEIVFHNCMAFTAGVPDPMLVFSAVGGDE